MSPLTDLPPKSSLKAVATNGFSYILVMRSDKTPLHSLLKMAYIWKPEFKTLSPLMQLQRIGKFIHLRDYDGDIPGYPDDGLTPFPGGDDNDINRQAEYNAEYSEFMDSEARHEAHKLGKLIKAGLLVKEEDFDETKHPRKDDGKFAPKGEGGGGGVDEKKMPKRMHLGGGRTMEVEPEAPPAEEKPEKKPYARIKVMRRDSRFDKPKPEPEPPPTPKAPTIYDLPDEHWSLSRKAERETTGTAEDWDTADNMLSHVGKVLWRQTGDFEWVGVSDGMHGVFHAVETTPSGGGMSTFTVGFENNDGDWIGGLHSSPHGMEFASHLLASHVKDLIETGTIRKDVEKPEDPHTGWYKEPAPYFGIVGEKVGWDQAMHILDGYKKDPSKMLTFKESRNRPDELISLVPDASRTHDAHFKVWHYMDETGNEKYYAAYFENHKKYGASSISESPEGAVKGVVEEMEKRVAYGYVKKPLVTPAFATKSGGEFKDNAEFAIEAANLDHSKLIYSKKGDNIFFIPVGGRESNNGFYGFETDDGRTGVRLIHNGSPIGETFYAYSGMHNAIDILQSDIQDRIVSGEIKKPEKKKVTRKKKNELSSVTMRIQKLEKPLYSPSPDRIEETKYVASREIGEMAHYEGVSVEEMTAKIEDKLRKAIVGKPLRKRIHLDDLEKVLRDPEQRFKTQFEVGDSDGYYSPSTRAAAEDFGLGYPRGVDARLRPVYGYIEEPERHKKGKRGPSGYGEISMVFKPSVAKRATVTVGDSLGDMGAGRQCGSPVMNPTTECLDNNVYSFYNSDFDGYSYLETQIHGGVTMDEVDEVVFHERAFDYDYTTRDYQLTGAYKEMEDKMKAMGIKVRYERNIE